MSCTTRIGALCWTAAAPLFLAATVVTGLAWRNPRYSWSANNISDLGNVTCGVWDTSRPRYVCSPGHTLMNVSIVVTAVLLAVGALLIWRTLGRGFAARTAQVLFLLAALGYALAGAFPADVNENWHFLGALLIFGLGNLGLLVAAASPQWTKRGWALVAGLTGLAGSGLFFGQYGLGIGAGGMERVAAFPLLLWAFAVGVRGWRHRHAHRDKHEHRDR